jgi:hypothetical protein
MSGKIGKEQELHVLQGSLVSRECEEIQMLTGEHKATLKSSYSSSVLNLAYTLFFCLEDEEHEHQDMGSIPSLQIR